MILLDTNVISALMQQTPDPVVVRWLDDQPAQAVGTTSITVFEVQYGLALLESGHRRRQLEAAFQMVLEEDLGGRLLPFERRAAREAALIAAAQRIAGRMVEFRDVQIAGIAIANKAILATRNTRHFDNVGMHLVNPWASGSTAG